MKSDGVCILNRFLLGELLVSPPSDSELPSLYKGFDSKNNIDVIIKIWRRQQNLYDGDLEVIWRSEIHLLQRLSGYPGGREYLIPMLDAGSDPNGFYLILQSDQLLPMQCYIQQSPSTPSPHSKHLFWSNIRRLAKGLGLIHSHGLIHRNLDEWAIFTDGGENPNYKLGGFEWSIRLCSQGLNEVVQPKSNNETEVNAPRTTSTKI